ncbi:hypothetical protein D5R40_08695 [Okeania hirsuta]|uniref:Uncharacterized protein n=1 Tax=Okeania hirsuta TaxID=1458930 RepID=A0A3N6PEU9_9CYAN|nr:MULTISPECIES: hypothetical protein [Okeania]NET75196.1 hypothetical protein [Okeania sp. SIO1F9]RQH47490.1 hypothetical protein D5R40_08695 [Okeania hirsuta]
MRFNYRKIVIVLTIILTVVIIIGSLYVLQKISVAYGIISLRPTSLFTKAYVRCRLPQIISFMQLIESFFQPLFIATLVEVILILVLMISNIISKCQAMMGATILCFLYLILIIYYEMTFFYCIHGA